jgi:hypothetical protein
VAVCGVLWPFVAFCGFLWPFLWPIACVENLGSSGNLEKIKKSFAILGEYSVFRFVADNNQQQLCTAFFFWWEMRGQQRLDGGLCKVILNLFRWFEIQFKYAQQSCKNLLKW